MVADQSTIQSSSETLNDFYGLSVGAAGRRGMLRSTGSSSSTSLEVSEIFEGARRLQDGGHPPAVTTGVLCGGPLGDMRVVTVGTEVSTHMHQAPVCVCFMPHTDTCADLLHVNGFISIIASLAMFYRACETSGC